MKKLLALALAMSATAALADASLDLTIKVNKQEPVKTLVASCIAQNDSIKINDDLAMNVQLIAEDSEGATISIIITDATSHEVVSAPVLKTAWGEPAQMVLASDEAQDETNTIARLALDITLIATQK